MVQVELTELDGDVVMPVPLQLLRDVGFGAGDSVQVTVQGARMIIERHTPRPPDGKPSSQGQSR
jgi:uncharacterized protein YebE (UPF0316 family)